MEHAWNRNQHKARANRTKVNMLSAHRRDQSGTDLAAAPDIHSCWQFDAAAKYVVTMHQAGSQLPPDAFNAFVV